LQKQPEERDKTPASLSYTMKLFEFKISEATAFFEQQKENPNLNENMIKGFDQFLESLDEYFEMYKIDSAEDCQIKIFGSVTLNNRAILRATNKFQNHPWFSNIAIAMNNEELSEYPSDKGICYAKVSIDY